jgi:hypothetical protein
MHTHPPYSYVPGFFSKNIEEHFHINVMGEVYVESCNISAGILCCYIHNGVKVRSRNRFEEHLKNANSISEEH